MAIVAPVTCLDTAPGIGAFLGASQSVSILDDINRQWGNTSGVIFGLPGAGYDKKLADFQRLVSLTDQTVRQVQQVMSPDQLLSPYITVSSEEQLYYMPTAMQLPILLAPAVRPYWEANRIYGYGQDPELWRDVPDIYGRLLLNGQVEWHAADTVDTIKPMLFEYESCDPTLSEEELERIDQSRKFIENFLIHDLQQGGERRDPTDHGNPILR